MEWFTLFHRTAGSLRTHPVVMTLATCDASGSPHARSVVCRHVDRDGSLWFASDARSAKNAQLDAHPIGEAVAWMPETREQFRFFGPIRRLTAAHRGDERLGIWQRLSDSSRALFFWPPPGEPRIGGPDAFPQSVPETTFPPMTFELLVLEPEQVEHLSVAGHPHARRRWRRDAEWNGEDLNP